MLEDLFDLAFLSGALAAGVTLLVALGFVRLAVRARGLVGNLAVGVMLIHVSVFAGTAFRDLAPTLLPPAMAEVLRAPTSLLALTLALNLLVFMSGLCSLRALHLAIPEKERGRYSLLTAAFYPPWRASRGAPDGEA